MTRSTKLATAALTGLFALGGLTACMDNGSASGNGCKANGKCKSAGEAKGNSCKANGKCKSGSSCKDSHSCK